MAALDAEFVLVMVAGFLSAVEYKRTLKLVSKLISAFKEDKFVIHHPNHGQVTRIYENGTKEITHYREGVEHGQSNGWHSNGRPSMVGSYVNGALDGLYRDWYDNGVPAQKYTVVSGRIHGVYLSWHRNGQMDHKSWCKHGEPHGLHFTWHDNGQIHHARHYFNGRIYGMEYSWNRDGELTFADGNTAT